MRPESPPNSPRLSILSDQPADEDQLNFALYAKTLAGIIADGSVQTQLWKPRPLYPSPASRGVRLFVVVSYTELDKARAQSQVCTCVTLRMRWK